MNEDTINSNLHDIAARIRDLQTILEKTDADIAADLSITAEEYQEYKSGEKDFSFTVLYKLAKLFDVDVTDLITGETPKLSFFSIIRENNGLPVVRRSGFTYQSMAYLFKNRGFDPLVVTAPYSEENLTKPVEFSTHTGQEFNMVLHGKLKMFIGDHEDVLNEGDCIYYDSSKPHGMYAISEDGCRFLSVLVK